MKNFIPLLILFLLPLLLSNTTSTTKVEFYKGSLTGAKEQAGREGKLYMVDFVANYCYMCKMMDETTFTDYRVVDYLKKNYIPIKINVDDFDGIVWKQKYNVRLLPTIIIFNSKGEVVSRYEESMGGTRMLEILTQHNTSANRVVFNHGSSSSTTTTSSTTSNPSPVSQPDISEPPSSIPLPVPAGTGLFEFSVNRANSNGYGVQIGVFAEYGNVLREVEKLESKFKKKVLVNINQLNNKTVYKVIVGQFSSRSSADSFKNTMETKGVAGYVTDLSLLR